MTQLGLIVGAGLREQLRWARRHLYLLLVLSPLVLGMTYFGVGRLVEDNPEWRLSPRLGVLLGSAVAAGLVALSMSRASVEIYHTRSPESLFDTLPVSIDTHLWAALARRATRTAVAALAALVARTLVDAGGPAGATLLAALVLLVALTTVAEALAAVAWIHWGHTRARAPAAASLVLLLAAVFVCGLLLVTVVVPEMLAARGRAGALGGGALLAAALFFVVTRLHRRWRAADIEYAKRLREGGGRGPAGRLDGWRRFGSEAVAAQLARDLRLTLRAFSSAVYVCCGIAGLWVVVLAAVLTTGLLPPAGLPAGMTEAGADAAGWFEATWLPAVLAVKIANAFAAVSLCSLVPVLVAHQTPHLWLERVAGTSGVDLWQAKLWYARLVSLPAPLAVWAVGAGVGQVPLFYVLPLLAEVLWLWWLISSLVGALAFEIPEQPGLALILMGCGGLAVGLFVSFLWPMGLAVYAFGLGQAMLLGQQSALRHLVKEGD